MKNDNMSAKERNLIKGAIRRVFSRSDLRRRVVEASIIQGHTDASRPRVKTWCRCSLCQTPTPKSYMQCDHIDPLIPVDQTLEDLSWDTVVDRTWCSQNNLQSICPTCHDEKTKLERKARLKYKKERKLK